MNIFLTLYNYELILVWSVVYSIIQCNASLCCSQGELSLLHKQLDELEEYLKLVSRSVFHLFVPPSIPFLKQSY